MEGNNYYPYEIISTQNISIVGSICCGKHLNGVILTVRKEGCTCSDSSATWLRRVNRGTRAESNGNRKKTSEKMELYLGFEESAKYRQVEGYFGRKNHAREETDGISWHVRNW